MFDLFMREKLRSDTYSTAHIDDVRLIGLRDFAWEKGFPGVGTNTTLICFKLMGMYPRDKLALSDIRTFPASSSKPCCSIMGIIPSMPGNL